MHAEKQHFCFVFRSPTNNWFQYVLIYFYLCYCREEILVTMCWKVHIISISIHSIYQSEHFKALLSALFKILRGCLFFFNIQIPSFKQTFSFTGLCQRRFVYKDPLILQLIIHTFWFSNTYFKKRKSLLYCKEFPKRNKWSELNDYW